jgi:hypothetical protein
MTSIPTRFFLLGYCGYLLPRIVRRMIAGTEYHRAWLAGDMGILRADQSPTGTKSGVCDRKTFHPRKGPHRAVATPSHLMVNLLYPYGE